MNESINESKIVLNALKNTSKGKLNYDRNWKEDKRTQEIISEVKLQLSSITISPKSLENNQQIKGLNENKDKHSLKYKVIESVNNQLIVDNNIEDKNKTYSNECLNNKNDSINEMDLLLYEKERQESVRIKIEEHIKEIESISKEYDEQIEEELRLIRQRYILAAIKKTNAFEEEYKALKDAIICKQINFDDNSMSASFKLKEIESKHQLLVEEQEKKQQEIRRKQILSLRAEIDSIVQNVIDLSNSTENDLINSELFQSIKHEIHSLISLVQSIDVLLTKTDLTNFDVSNVQNFKMTANHIKNKIVSDIDNEKRNIQQKQSQSLSISNAPIIPIDNNDVHVMPESNQNSSIDSSNALSEFVDYQAFKDYLNLQKFSNDFENSFKSFITESKFKQKKNELQLFVKTTINTISCESVDHVRDKLNRLTLLFNEKNVEYGGKQISCSNKDASLNFCISLASKMFISVSTKQKDIALTMAPIIVQLWSRFPTFGQIFMAQMQEKCPYIIPYYPKKETDDSERDHLIACGYNIAKDGTQESEESFLNRMKAMVKLYAAIIQSNLQDNHPHDLNYGWTWTARLLNLEPRTAITAAVLESFLSITSHKFYRFYRKQFIKIIKFILSDYIPRIENVSKKGTKRQSLVKLSMFIIDVNKKLEKNVNYKELMPEGILPDYFFQTSYSHSWGTQTFA